MCVGACASVCTCDVCESQIHFLSLSLALAPAIRSLCLCVLYSLVLCVLFVRVVLSVSVRGVLSTCGSAVLSL